MDSSLMNITQDIISVGAQAPIFFAPNTEEILIDIESNSSFKAKVYIGYSNLKSYKNMKDKDGLVLLDDMLITENYSSIILANPKYIIISVSEVNKPLKIKLTTEINQKTKELAA